ncbi:MAG TPA: CvpA family protein [Thermomicrobiales bacterium]|nr:CvpA family protein [Thermomicrobiales bacterium]
MNILDAIIIIIISALVLIGFFSGVGRIVATLIALYFATIVSATFYDSIAVRIREGVEGVGVSTAELTAFLILFGTFAAAFYWVATFSFKTMSARRGRFVILDNIGGAALAVMVGLLTVAMTLSVTVILIGALSQTSVTSDGQEQTGFLTKQIRGSELAPVVLKIQPPVSATFKPWFSGELPVILQPPPD